MSLRKDFIHLTSAFSRVLPLGMLRALSGQRFVIPFYHIVSDEPCPHIEHLYSYKGVKQFERDIDYLASNYTPVDASDLDDVVVGKYQGQNIMLLTFDDGLRQMHDIVAPILMRKGIPAVFFLNTDFIDNKALMFRYAASLAVGKDPVRYASTLGVKTKEELKAMMGAELESLSADFLSNYKPYMSSEQVHSLIDQGFAIGSHSSGHPYYHKLSLEQQLSQTFDSMDLLTKKFQLNQRLFAFPFTDHGVSKTFFEKTLTDRRLDFTFGGAGIKSDIHPRQFQRVPMEGWHADAEQILKSEYLYYALRASFFKNTIHRS
jgi:peptidoglycan/xylan/chitin deacetylase (PgdA/CDA1 family)